MAEQLTAESAQTALRGHVVERAMEAKLKHGFWIDAEQITRLLDDRSVVRYPVGIRFDEEPLEPGEFAWAMPLGDTPAEGFCLFIHPHFEDHVEAWPLLIAYHIPSINYGEIVSHEDAELFGATLLGLEPDAYYQALCELVDSIPS